jgi:hypothetical protein
VGKEGQWALHKVCEDELDVLSSEFILITELERTESAKQKKTQTGKEDAAFMALVKAALKTIRFFLISSTYLSRQKNQFHYKPAQYTD